MLITQPFVVPEYASDELEANRLTCTMFTLEEAAAVAVHSSLIGIIPKKYKPRKWRLIVDLSAPEKESINNGIKKSTAACPTRW